SISAGGPPLYGTWTILVLVMCLKSSMPKCPLLPTPVDAYLNWSGFAFASAISSCTVFTGRLGLTTSTFGPTPSIATHAKDFSGSNGSLWMIGLVVNDVEM